MVLISLMKNILSGSNLPIELNFAVKLRAQNRLQIKVLCLCSLFSILYSVLVGITLHCLREWRWVTNNPFLPLSPKNQPIKPQKKHKWTKAVPGWWIALISQNFCLQSWWAQSFCSWYPITQVEGMSQYWR